MFLTSLHPHVHGHWPTLSLPRHPLTPRKATWLVLSRPETLQVENLQLIDRLRAMRPEVELAIDLAQSFAMMVRQHLEESLDPWLERAKTSSLTAFRSFAAGIRRDYAAVRAALSLLWSNELVAYCTSFAL